MKLTELEISLRESKESCLRDFTAETIASLTSLGFTLPEIVDAIANYVYLNAPSIDAVCHLSMASLALLDRRN